MAARALIVDDEPDLELLIRQRFQRKIRNGDYEFVFARNGLEALNKLKEDPTLEIVLSDINMPVMDGLAFLSNLREIDRPITTVIVSAYGDMQNIRAAMNCGAYDFLTKPIDFEDFELTLSKAIADHQSGIERAKAREEAAALKADPATGDRLEADRAEFELIPFDLRDVVARAVAVVEIRAAVKGISLRQSIDPEVPLHLIGDRDRTLQMLVNLLTTAVKFGERGGLEVRVVVDPARPAPGRLRFAVVDAGNAIPTDKIDQLLMSLAELDGAPNPQQLAGLLNGRVWVERDRFAGNTFFFVVEFDVQESVSGRTPEFLLPPGAGDFNNLVLGLKILLADASEDNRLRIDSYLKGTRSTLDVVEDAADAMALFDPGCYDVVLLDLEAAARESCAAARQIRRIEDAGGFPPTPLLGMTAQTFAGTADEPLAVGFSGLLQKPIRRNALLEALVRYLPAPRRDHWRPPS